MNLKQMKVLLYDGENIINCIDQYINLDQIMSIKAIEVIVGDSIQYTGELCGDCTPYAMVTTIGNDRFYINRQTYDELVPKTSTRDLVLNRRCNKNSRELTGYIRGVPFTHDYSDL